MTVEDGTGLVDSNSYVTVAFANDYLASMGVTAWSALTQDKKEVLLVKATDYVDNTYRWRGRKSTQEQALQFPRTGCVDDDGNDVVGIPRALQQAVCMSASVLITEESLYAVEESNGAVVSEKIGQLAFTYDVSKKVKGSSLYDSINLRLRGLFNAPGGILYGDIEKR